jgi:plasmid stabilization system protein ParE
VARLRRFPEIGGRVPEFEELGLREIVHGNYRVIYRYEGNAVLILTVHHGAKPLTQSSLRE